MGVWLSSSQVTCVPMVYHLIIFGVARALCFTRYLHIIYSGFFFLQFLSGYSFSQSMKETVMNFFDKLTPEELHLPDDTIDTCTQESSEERKHQESIHMEEVWQMLYNDCLSALEICVEGDLKHFHKARYMLAQGLYRRGLSGDLERAKDELSFCFKSSRSSFTINMWEIDGMVKKGRYEYD